jgi:hypothetical protein
VIIFVGSHPLRKRRKKEKKKERKTKNTPPKFKENNNVRPFVMIKPL